MDGTRIVNHHVDQLIQRHTELSLFLLAFLSLRRTFQRVSGREHATEYDGKCLQENNYGVKCVLSVIAILRVEFQTINDLSIT